MVVSLQGKVFVTALTEVAHAVARNPDTPISSIDLMSQTVRAALLGQMNQTDHTLPDCTIHALTEMAALRLPDQAALIWQDGAMSHGALDAAANRLAHFLQSCGIGRGALVALCLTRSADLAVATLAVLKAGAAYVPIDPLYPVTRLAQIIDDCRPTMMLTEPDTAALGRGLARQSGFTGAVLDIRTDAGQWAGLSSAPPEASSSDPKNTAYVIYTSGTSGKPKGVVVPHCAVVNLLIWAETTFKISPSDRMLMATSFSFDISALELFLPLATGATVVLAAPDFHADPQEMSDLIRDKGITVVQVVPTMLRLLLENGPADVMATLRLLLCGGEALPPDLVRQCHAVLPSTRLINMYGPTETTIWSLWHDCLSDADQPLKSHHSTPIGRPLNNTKAYVLDSAFRPVAVGVAGQLFIGGIGLAKGYLGDATLTDRQFIASPFAENERIYRTGDLAKILETGLIEFLGRADFQIKVRGFRIEAAEVESHLVLAGARAAIAIARDDRLLAYVIGIKNVDQLVRQLEQNLPQYMIPSAIVPLVAFPLTPNGKIDRAALPDPDPSLFRTGRYAAPEGEVEETLTQIWHEVLTVSRIGRYDNFFALGGTSLSAIRVIATVSDVMGEKIPLRYLFDFPTVAGLAASLIKDFLQDAN